MGHEPVDTLHGQAVATADVEGRGVHVGNGVLVDKLTVLEEVVFTGVDSGVGCGLERASGLHHEVVAANAVDVEHGVDHAGLLLGGLHKHCGGTVAE